MYYQRRSFVWYLAFVVVFLFILKNPVAAGHLARQCGHLLFAAAGALSRLAGSL